VSSVVSHVAPEEEDEAVEGITSKSGIICGTFDEFGELSIPFFSSFHKKIDDG
jgi:hypothetical protein